MKKRLILVLFILFIIPISYAQCQDFIGGKCAELKWERAEAKSGDVAEIVISPSNPNTMYVGFEVNVHSLYKSIDGGKTCRRSCKRMV